MQSWKHKGPSPKETTDRKTIGFPHNPKTHPRANDVFSSQAPTRSIEGIWLSNIKGLNVSLHSLVPHNFTHKSPYRLNILRPTRQLFIEEANLDSSLFWNLDIGFIWAERNWTAHTCWCGSHKKWFILICKPCHKFLCHIYVCVYIYIFSYIRFNEYNHETFQMDKGDDELHVWHQDKSNLMFVGPPTPNGSA